MQTAQKLETLEYAEIHSLRAASRHFGISPSFEFIHSQTDSQIAAEETGFSVTAMKLKPPSKQPVLDWVVAAWKATREKKALIEKSFKVCGISNSLDGSEDHLIRTQVEQPEESSTDDELVELTEDPFAQFELAEA